MFTYNLPYLKGAALASDRCPKTEPVSDSVLLRALHLASFIGASGTFRPKSERPAVQRTLLAAMWSYESKFSMCFFATPCNPCTASSTLLETKS
jgi:hypothetical protein